MMDLLEHIRKHGNLVIAEGVLIEFVRRGQVQPGSLVPEVVVDNPEAVRALHQEFCDAGSDVVQAFTYYAHREKLRQIGREHEFELMNRRALQIAKEVARKNGKLFAGGLSNSTIYNPDDHNVQKEIEAMFEEQCKWAKEEGVDYMIAETMNDYGEASLALRVMKRHGLTSVVSLNATSRDGMTTFDGVPTDEALHKLEEQGADVVTLNCQRGIRTMIPVIEKCRAKVKGPLGCLPVCYRTDEKWPTFCRFRYPDSDESCYPNDVQMYQCSHKDIQWFAQRCKEIGLEYVGLCCGNTPSFMKTLALEYGREVKYANDRITKSIIQRAKQSANTKRDLWKYAIE